MSHYHTDHSNRCCTNITYTLQWLFSISIEYIDLSNHIHQHTHHHRPLSTPLKRTDNGRRPKLKIRHSLPNERTLYVDMYYSTTVALLVLHSSTTLIARSIVYRYKVQVVLQHSDYLVLGTGITAITLLHCVTVVLYSSTRSTREYQLPATSYQVLAHSIV